MKPQQKNQSDFVFFKNYETRWRDNDVYHHMNNAVFIVPNVSINKYNISIFFYLIYSIIFLVVSVIV